MIYVSFFAGTDLTYFDEKEYMSIAHNLAEHGIFSLDGEHYTAYRPPLFPAVLSLILRCGGDITVMKSVNIAFLTATAFLMSLMLLKRFGIYAAASSVGLTVLYPIIWYAAGTIYPQVMGSFLLISILAVIVMFTGSEVFRGMIIGCLLGLLILTIPTFVFMLPIMMLWEFRNSKKWKNVAAVLLVTAVVISPWMIRNYMVFDEAVFISTNSGLNLLVGNSENTTASSGTEVDIDKYIANAPKGTEAVIDRYYRTQALIYMKENIPHTAVLYIQKVIHHFSLYNSFATENVTTVVKQAVMAISYALILFLIGLRLIRAERLTDIEVLCLCIYVVAALVQSVFFTRIRFRIPFEMLLIVVSAIGVHYRLLSRKVQINP
ncbi:MAG: hypothetical protein ACOYNS_01405 [Bacteroidota bacterium]